MLEVMRYLAALSDIPGEVWRERIPRLLRQVNLWEDRTKKAGKLSGGMKRRLGIAQALMEEPDVLILDEPFNGLDKKMMLHMREVLVGEKRKGKTILMASHNEKDIEYICDRTYEIDAGRILSGS